MTREDHHITVHELLMKRYPEEMAEYNAAPWDYRITGPVSMDDEAILTVSLKIGERKLLKAHLLEVEL